ncbi:linker for activation of T-cells family member 1 isoform X2 [Dendropsophus ebraccatus]|uniref:linker for activation of T-cells family member 1 isoform X2 n=1 Tax=Dendropsophus ebraccatus TaxID=150705 RepID=UPI0038316F26
MMDISTVMYSFVFVLPIILLTALCVSCRKKIPSHITERGYYDNNPPYTPQSSSFMIINKPQPLPRTVSSPATMCQKECMLTIPRSPITESRRSSVGREIRAYSDACDSIPHSPSAPILKSPEDNDYDDEGEDGNYSNDNPACGYIEVLPDEGTVKIVPALVVTCEVDNRASLSSVGTDENYVNVVDSDDAKASSSDGNYVNVGDASDTTGGSLEYVNVEEAESHPSSTNQESEDDDTPEYENVEKGHKG